MSLTEEERSGAKQQDFLACFIEEKEKDETVPGV